MEDIGVNMEMAKYLKHTFWTQMNQKEETGGRGPVRVPALVPAVVEFHIRRELVSI